MKFNIIYMDVPWPFKTYSDKGKEKSAEKHYKVMTIDDIKNLPIKDVAEKDCALLFWATSPLLPEAMEIIKSYGFTFKTVLFVWVKKNKKATDTNFWGLGYYSRSNCEYLLLATRGKNPKVLNHSIHQVAELPVESHSQKPTAFRDKIVELFGQETKVLELFSRNNFQSQNYPNFTFCGGEFNNEDVLDSIERLKNL